MDNKEKCKIKSYRGYDKSFQYAVTVTLSYEKLEYIYKEYKILRIKPFINKYSWKTINYQSGKDGWRNVQKNNATMALNVLYERETEISPAYVLYFKTQIKQQQISLPRSKKVICIIKSKNFKTQRQFLLIEWPLLYQNRK